MSIFMQSVNFEFRIRYNSNDEVSIQLYYLNFNRIDMKKQILTRNNKSASRNKPENLTKASSRKHHKKIIKRKTLAPKPLVSPPLCPTQIISEETIKDQSEETCEKPCNIPSNLNVQGYIDEINNHIMDVDRQFHLVLESGLKITQHLQISKEMRKILVRWLVKVTLKFKMKQQSLHTCIQLIDYMLIHHGGLFNKSNFQLLGIASLFISCKYNQIYTLEADKYIDLCDGLYTTRQLFEMEGMILVKINFNLQIPTLSQFIRNFIYHYKIDEQQEKLINTVIDLSLFDFNLLNNYRKHDLAFTIIYFSTKIQKLDGLKQQLGELKTKICPQTFKKCFIAVMSLFKRHNQKINETY